MATSRTTDREEPSAASDDATPATHSKPVGTARYLQFDRKELRIRGDQADELSTLTRQLNRTRAGTGARITDNTLIRVAIDMLLSKRATLHGVTEEELRYSVTPELREL